MCAADKGHKEVVQLLLERGADADIQNSEGRTALFHAIDKGREQVVQLLLEKGATPDLQGPLEMTALHVACDDLGHEKVVQLLLEGSADPDLHRYLGGTALHIALIEGNPKVVDLLLLHNASIHQRDAHGRAALHFALYGHAPDTGRFVDQFWSLTVQANDTDRHGRGLLHHAAAHGCVRELHRLLDDGFDPHFPDKDGWSPLHWAARSGSIPAIEMLRQAGADENAVTVDGSTPRTIAMYHQNDSVLPLLRAHDPDCPMEQADTSSILDEVSGHHHKDVRCYGCYLVCELSTKTRSGKTSDSVKRAYMESVTGVPFILISLSTTAPNALDFQGIYILSRALSAGRLPREKRMDKMVVVHTHHSV